MPQLSVEKLQVIVIMRLLARLKNSISTTKVVCGKNTTSCLCRDSRQARSICCIWLEGGIKQLIDYHPRVLIMNIVSDKTEIL